MLQEIKNFLKKILPPPVRVFNREIARVIDAVADLKKAIKSLSKVQDQIAKDLLLSRSEQMQILNEIASLQKEQEHLISQLALAQKERAQMIQLNKELYQQLSLQMHGHEEMIASLAKENAELQQHFEKQDEKLSCLNKEIQRQGHRVVQTINRTNRHAANAPILSVLIPVYNVEPYLRDCLDSVINQSMKEIEIICVDDGSTDASGDILDEYARKDPRINVIHKEKNAGLLLARKTAVEAASGEYILFVDSDDIVDPDLCAFAEEVTQNEYADIIQFGADVQDFSNNTAKTAWLYRMLTPADSEYANEDILKEAYVNRSYVTSLWGKLYKSALCKKAYASLPDMYCYLGEDIFTYFYLAYYARHYKGIPTQCYYTYRHGLGITNVDTMSLEKYESYCNMSTFVQYIYDHLIQGTEDPCLRDAYNGMVRRIAEDCCYIYKSRIREEDKQAALSVFSSYWGDNPVANEAAQRILGISAGNHSESKDE